MTRWTCLAISIALCTSASARSLAEQSGSSQADHPAATASQSDSTLDAQLQSRSSEASGEDVWTAADATLDEQFCSVSSCKFDDAAKAASCAERGDVDTHLHLVHQEMRSCGVLGPKLALTPGYQHRCCAQTCKADVECPKGYFCNGFNNGQKYCFHCEDCPAESEEEAVVQA